MDNIQTDEIDNYQPRRSPPIENYSVFTKLAMKLGAKTYKQAQFSLLCISILIFVIAITLISQQFFSGDKTIVDTSKDRAVFDQASQP